MKQKLIVLFLCALASTCLHFFFKPTQVTDKSELKCVKLLEPNNEVFESFPLLGECERKYPAQNLSLLWIANLIRNKSPETASKAIKKSLNYLPEEAQNKMATFWVGALLQTYSDNPEHSDVVYWVDWGKGLEGTSYFERKALMYAHCLSDEFEECAGWGKGVYQVFEDEADLERLLYAYWKSENYIEFLKWSEKLSTEKKLIYKAKIKRAKKEAIDNELLGIDSEYFEIRLESKLDSLLIESMDEINSAYVQLSNKLNFYPEKKIEIVVFESKNLSGENGFPNWAVAVYDGKVRLPSTVLLDEKNRKSVFIHELSHGFLIQETGVEIPTWFHEGFAMWLEGTRKKEELKMHFTYQELSQSFIKLKDENISLAYSESYAFFMSVLEKVGEGGVLNLVNRLRDAESFEEAFFNEMSESPIDHYNELIKSNRR